MTDQPYILGMINARGGSKGVPGKNIKPLGGKPLIAWSIEVAAQVPELTRTIVSTESTKIADVAKTYGGDVPFMRPKELASDTSVQLDTIIYNVERLEKEEGRSIDAVALLQPTHPFRHAQDVSGCIQKMMDTNADSVITIAPNKHHPVGLWSIENDGLQPFIEQAKKVGHGFNRQQMKPLYLRTGSVYVISRKTLLGSRSLYGAYNEGYIVDDIRSWINIDDMNDWSMAEAWNAYLKDNN